MKKPDGICDIQGGQPTDQQSRLGDTSHEPDKELGLRSAEKGNGRRRPHISPTH